MSHDSHKHDEQVNEAIAWFYQEREAGRDVSDDALLARYPSLREELSRFLDDQHAFRAVAGSNHVPLSEATTVGPSSYTPSPLLGTVRYVGDYELLVEIARGGMGVVYRARQVSLNRIVALKMILSGEYASAADKERFRLESEAAANLDHTHILPIYEVGEHEGRPYFSMKLAEGGSLSAELPELKENPRAAAAIMKQLAEAVHFAHLRGILHRDLKPSNILVDKEGHPLITDFGLAKKVGSEVGLTHTGAIVGTPAYMSPEQARADKQLTTSTDVYSLGAILYEMLTGRPPFRAGTTYETIMQVIEQPAANPRTVNPLADRDLSAIALKCLEKEPGKRYASANTLADDLQRWINHEPTVARPLSFWGMAARWLRQYAAADVAIIGLGFLSGIIGILVLFAFRSNQSFILLPPDASWLHPITWMHAAETQPVVRWSVLILAVVLVLSIGWLVRLIIRPKSLQQAMVAAASLALLATLVAYALLAPGIATDATRTNENFFLHPIDDPGKGIHVYDTPTGLTEKNERYLRQFLSPDTPRDREVEQLRNLQQRALSMNTMHAVLVTSSIMLVFVAFILFTIALHSTWAAHHLATSGRSMLRCGLCYLELYLPAMVFLTWSIISVVIAITLNSGVHEGNVPKWWQFFLPWLLILALVVLTHIGVVRRWRWGVRLCLYLVWISGAYGIAKLVGIM